MKRLRGRGQGGFYQENGRFECDEIVLDLDHGRTLSIRRATVVGEDGIMLCAGIERDNRTANGGFVIRATNFAMLHLSIEQAR
jgi:hypothetical protein